ncbi:hypothetical protein HXX76_008752 [Chlamydomonas incerta]|uniref:Sm domain-containing protein n=1 Tax=Chlamydomonas incerta TaxID=51695 RepID=A0A835T7F5_CHLIN|nr:hypothetical protein HXX76_008752 [Chlamydomonas incerta]|eukprot:KAG2433025.1 hypothetical protein HXX76_008752 [Chlamydomonas incerta]
MQGSAYFPPPGGAPASLPVPRFPPGRPPTVPPVFGRGRGKGRDNWLPQDFVKGRKRPRRRRKLPPRSETTLVCLIKSLIDRRVVVELRNDTLVKAQLDDVDDFLNMTLSDVTFQTVEGVKSEYAHMYLKGRNIRFVHLPKSLDPARAIDMYRQRVIRTKLDALQERARSLGSVQRGPKGPDAMDASGAAGAGPEEEEDLDEGEEYDDEEEYEEGEAYDEEGEDAGGSEGGDAAWRGPAAGPGSEGGVEPGVGGGGGAPGAAPLPGLAFLDPRAAAAAAAAGGQGGDEEDELGLW